MQETHKRNQLISGSEKDFGRFDNCCSCRLAVGRFRCCCGNGFIRNLFTSLYEFCCDNAANSSGNRSYRRGGHRFGNLFCLYRQTGNLAERHGNRPNKHSIDTDCCTDLPRCRRFNRWNSLLVCLGATGRS